MLCFHKKNNPSEVDPINHNLWIVCKMQSLPIRFYYQNCFHKNVKCWKQGCNFEWGCWLDKHNGNVCDCELDKIKYSMW